MGSHAINERLTPDGHTENKFREEVRDILNLDLFTRDYVIFDELRRLKVLERKLNEQHNK